MRCLVTGGAGFIGSHLCDALVANNHDVISVDNYVAGKFENIKHLTGNPKFTEVNADICDYWVMNDLIKDVDFIFNQAASKKNVCDKDPRQDLKTNAEGTYNLLELAVKHRVAKFIHASTGSVYGEAVGVQDENHPLSPASYYGVSKLAGEKYVQLFHKMHKLDTIIFRYFHVYGKRQDDSKYGGVIAIFDKALREDEPIVIYGDGTQQRSFTHVDDVVWCNLIAMFNDKAIGNVYNCASGIKVNINTLAFNMMEIHNKQSQQLIYKDWLPGDVKVFDIDNSKILEDFNIDFETNLMNGLIKTI